MQPLRPWLTVLTTPERPHYLQATLDAIDFWAGGDGFDGEKAIIIDGDGADIPGRRGWWVGPGLGIINTPIVPLGAARAMLSIVRAAAAGGASSLLYFEDDLAFCRHAVTLMERTPIPDDCWALQFCDLKRIGPFRVPPPPVKLEITKHRTDHHWGNQALKLPAATLHRVAMAAEDAAHWPQKHSSDVLLGHLATSAARPFLGVVAPSIVQHVGAESVCNPGRYMYEFGRAAHNFPGHEFNALSLEDHE